MDSDFIFAFMKSATLRDKNLECELNNNGFIVIRNFIAPQQVARLFLLYKQHFPDSGTQNAMWNSLYDVDFNTGIEISRKIFDILNPSLDSIFESYYVPVCTFMSKNCNEKSSCSLHRDFSIADENKFQYRNLWIPLVQTNEQNGALFVLKKSNKVFQYPLPMFAEWPYQSIRDLLFQKAQTVYCNAGDLVIYLDKTLHGSHLNRSYEPRPVVHFGALHPDTQLLFYFLDKQNRKVRTYEVTYEFYFENNFSEPKGRFPLHSEFDFNPPAVDYKECVV